MKIFFEEWIMWYFLLCMSIKCKSLRRNWNGGGLDAFSEKGGGDQPMAWRIRAAMSSTVPRPSMTFCLPWAA